MPDPTPTPEAWLEEPDDRAPPEPAPPDWAPPTPVEATVEMDAPAAAEPEAPPEVQAFDRKRRFWVTTAVYAALWLALASFVDFAGGGLTALLVVLPFYLLTLPFVLRTPRGTPKAKAALAERLDWQYKVMIAIVVFIVVYVPITFVSGFVLPFASVIEYGLFALLFFLLLRIGGRAVGIAPSVDALPPPSHRLHRQVIAPLDDAHYQRTLWLHYSFVEKGRGARNLAKRIDEILGQNGVPPNRRRDVLQELHELDEQGTWGLGRRRRERRQEDRERRAAVLERLFAQVNQELEQTA